MQRMTLRRRDRGRPGWAGAGTEAEDDYKGGRR